MSKIPIYRYNYFAIAQFSDNSTPHQKHKRVVKAETAILHIVVLAVDRNDIAS